MNLKRFLLAVGALVLAVPLARANFLFLSKGSSFVSPFNITFTPPTLTSPTTLFLPDDASLSFDSAFNSLVCSGFQYHLTLDNATDYIIKMKNGAAALQYPLIVGGGQNVRMIGLAIDLAVQSACAVGQVCPNGSNTCNIYPLTPSGRALLLAQTKTTYVEGAYIKMNGHESDCINGNNAGATDVNLELAQRNYVFEASRCDDYTGTRNSIHGDWWQQQYSEGNGVTDNLVFENFTVYSGMEGIIHPSNNSTYVYGVKKVVLRNANYRPSNVVPPSSDFLTNLPAADVATPLSTDTTFDNYWVQTFGTAFCWDNPTSGTCNFNPGNTPGLFSGTPPGGDYAPAIYIGLNYVSPFP